MDKNKNIWDLIYIFENKKLKKSILMCVDNISFDKAPIYLRIFIYLAQKLWALWGNKNVNLHYWKNSKTDSYKTVSQFAIEPYIFLAHDTIQILNCVIHY